MLKNYDRSNLACDVLIAGAILAVLAFIFCAFVIPETVIGASPNMGAKIAKSKNFPNPAGRQPGECKDAYDETDCYEALYEDNRSEQGDFEELVGDYKKYIVTHEMNWNHMVIFIELDGSLLDGSDSSCAEFARMMKYICDHNVLVYVTNSGFIPTVHNPIDEWWADRLAEAAGEPVPYIPAE